MFSVMRHVGFWGGILLVLLLSFSVTSAQGDDATPPFSELHISAQEQSIRAPIIQATPAQTLHFRVGQFVCCYFFESVDAYPVTWSVLPAQWGIMHPTEGELRIDPNTPHGTRLTIVAAYQGQSLEETVYVYRSEVNPLVGTWREISQLRCQEESEVVYNSTIGELAFFADGTYHLTWGPFEVYIDYGGTYQFDLTTGTLSMTMRGINYSPADFDGNFNFRFDARGDLILTEGWFGSAPYGASVQFCGYRFSQHSYRLFEDLVPYRARLHIPENGGFVKGILTANVYAQQTQANLPVADATLQLIRVKPENDQIVAQTMSNAMGEYHFENLVAGYYDLEVVGYRLAYGYPREVEGGYTYDLAVIPDDVQILVEDNTIMWRDYPAPETPSYFVSIYQFSPTARWIVQGAETAENRYTLPDTLSAGTYLVEVSVRINSTEIAKSQQLFSFE